MGNGNSRSIYFKFKYFSKLLNLSFYVAGHKGCSVLRPQGQFMLL